MFEILAGFLAGVVTSLAADIIWETWAARTWRVLRAKFKSRGNTPPPGLLKLGKTTVPWVVCSYSPYARENIETYYDPREVKKTAVIQEIYDELTRTFAREGKKGNPVPFNGLGYKLESFWTGKRAGALEEPVLVLKFRPTDYFTMLATDNPLPPA